MFYIIYLLAILIYLACGIGLDTSPAFFWDSTAMLYVLFPCFLMLCCTRSLKSFGNAFLFAFGKRDPSLSQARTALRSVKMTALTAVVFGTLDFMIGMINCFRYFGLASIEDASQLLVEATVLALSLFYPVLICIILLPVYFLLKKHIGTLKDI